MTDAMATLVGRYPGAFTSEIVAEALLVFRRRSKHTDPARVKEAAELELACLRVLTRRHEMFVVEASRS